jgi:small-conductance mechanosensitive channel
MTEPLLGQSNRLLFYYKRLGDQDEDYRPNINRIFMERFKNIFEYKILHFEQFQFAVYQIVIVMAIILVTKLIINFTKKIIARTWQAKKLNKGGQHSLFQLIKYFLWIVTIVLVLETIGVKVTFLLAGSAALLVGVGLGLQQTFNDVISGIILLFEGSIKIGDIIEIDGKVAKVLSIELRTSQVIDRDDIIVIVPNSKIVTDKVINWSHNTEKTRFSIDVGVAYGTDVDLVIDLLEKSAAEHLQCLSDDQKPTAIFSYFGDSAILFKLFFMSDELFRIEQIKSDIRRIISRKFSENTIQIPFPQRDLHLKTSNISFTAS